MASNIYRRGVFLLGPESVTQELKDKYIRRQNSVLKSIRNVSVAQMLFSIGAMACGVVALIRSGESGYEFPHNLPAGMFVGAPALVFSFTALVTFCCSKRYQNDTILTSFRCIMTLVLILDVFVMIAAIVYLGFMGIWALIDCLVTRESLKSCKHNSQAQIVIAVINGVLGSGLLICVIVSLYFLAAFLTNIRKLKHLDYLLHERAARGLDNLQSSLATDNNRRERHQQGNHRERRQETTIGNTNSVGEPIMIDGQLYMPVGPQRTPSAPLEDTSNTGRQPHRRSDRDNDAPPSYLEIMGKK